MTEYLFSYWFEGHAYSLSVEAETPEEAKRRVWQMANATYDGEVKARVRVGPSWLARLFGR